MPSPLNLTEHTIIIEPGSYYLKIGRVCDSTPRKFPHCIARLLSTDRKGKDDPLLMGGKPIFEEGVTRNSVWPDIHSLFSITVEKDLCLDENDIQHLTAYDPNQTCKDSPDHTRDFVALDDALPLVHNPRYRVTWPISYGFFRDDENYSSVLQDLEDIWSSALEKHLDIVRSDLASYRAILVIGDVFRRHEIRQLAELLLQRLGFSHLLVHQSAVCASYGLGVTTACVVDIGERKTSVCCVDNGISPPDTRVVLSVGRSNVLRTFHGISLPHGFNRGAAGHFDFDYNHVLDVCALRSWLNDAERATYNLLTQSKQLEKQESQHDEASSDQRFELTLATGQQRFTVPLRSSAVLCANLLPFRQINLIAGPIRSEKPTVFHECQMSPLDSSQPDDPFDDLYISMTARERRKRGAGQGAVAADTGATDATGDVKIEPDTTEVQPTPVTDPLIFSPDRSTVFTSLSSTVWWSICQCAFMASAQSATEASLVPYPMAPVSQASSEELRRRLLRCVVLVGGGSIGPAGSWIAKWLTSELSTCLASTLAINAPIENGNRPPVEIVTFDQPHDLAWCGARLLLTADSSNDLWIAQSEWSKYGSRILREKAPFLW